MVLEVKVPQQVLRPLRAMENVFNAIWGTYDPPSNWKPKHFDGKSILGASYELAGIDGVPHFFIRLPSSNRKLIESAIYSQYPEVEITEVPDYTKNVPANVPNKDWDIWGCDFMPLKSSVYPLKTYEQFFEESPQTNKEEKRIDPLSSFFETISRMEKGEQIWIQLIAAPIGVKEIDYAKAGRKEADKLSKRPEKPVQKPLLYDFWNLLIHGIPPSQPKEEESFLPPEMKLTSGERDVVSAIERKATKICYNTVIRYLYAANRKVFFGAAKGYGVSFFAQFSTQDLNGLKPWKKTITKIHAPDLFTARRLYLRKRDLFDKYVRRDSAFEPYAGGTTLLSTEELATMFHFPGIEVAPTLALKRIETKKGAPPAELPTID